jgi:uncharacterized protein (DUF4415 family)
MPENKKSTGRDWTSPDDAPELTDDFFDRAAIKKGDVIIRPAQGTLTRRGRPKLEHPKRQVTVRLDSDLVARARSAGFESRDSHVERIMIQDAGWAGGQLAWRGPIPLIFAIVWLLP